MKKSLLATLLIGVLAVLMPKVTMAQVVSKQCVDQYLQMVKMCNGEKHPTFEACSAQLEKYGFKYNKPGVIDVYTSQMHPFVRPEGQDTVVCMLVTFEGKVLTMSGVFISLDPTHTFSLITKASNLQAELAAQMGCTKYVGSVKGKVKISTYNREELLTTLANADADMVSMVFERWKSPDGRIELTCIYSNDLYGTKKPKANDRAKLTLSVGNTNKD